MDVTFKEAFMRRLLTFGAILCSFFFLASNCALARVVHVKGYTKKDGTYVRPHVRGLGPSRRSSGGGFSRGGFSGGSDSDSSDSGSSFNTPDSSPNFNTSTTMPDSGSDTLASQSVQSPPTQDTLSADQNSTSLPKTGGEPQLMFAGGIMLMLASTALFWKNKWLSS